MASAGSLAGRQQRRAGRRRATARISSSSGLTRPASALERTGPPPPPIEPLPRWPRAREVAGALGLSTKHAYDLMAAGVLPTMHINRAVRVPEDEPRADTARQAGGASAAPPPLAAGRRGGPAGRPAHAEEGTRMTTDDARRDRPRIKLPYGQGSIFWIEAEGC